MCVAQSLLHRSWAILLFTRARRGAWTPLALGLLLPAVVLLLGRRYSKAIAECAWSVTGKSRANANRHDIHQLLLGGQGVVVPIALKLQKLSELPPRWEQIFTSSLICFLQARRNLAWFLHWVFGTDPPFLLLGSAHGIFFSLVPAISSSFTWLKHMAWSLEKPAGRLSTRKEHKRDIK